MNCYASKTKTNNNQKEIQYSRNSIGALEVYNKFYTEMHRS